MEDLSVFNLPNSVFSGKSDSQEDKYPRFLFQLHHAIHLFNIGKLASGIFILIPSLLLHSFECESIEFYDRVNALKIVYCFMIHFK